jgi:hypothetical protein
MPVVRTGLLLLACLGALLVAAPAQAGQCDLPDAKPLWVDFADGSVPFWSSVFAKPGIVAAASNLIVPPQLRAAGAKTVAFDLNFKNRVGSPSVPASAEKIVPAADKLFDAAAQWSACDKPLVALNELFGASVPVPWTPTTTAYRANVLAFVNQLASRGARPFLLVSSTPFTGGEASDWWRQVARSSDIVLEVYFNGPSLAKQGPTLASRRLRTTIRQRVESLIAIGVPVARIGVMLQLGSTPGAGGRERLQPARAWYEVVKWEALAARHVANELGIASVWSWGWGTWNAAGNDPDKQNAACVWLWTRDASLCDGPAAAGPGWNASLTEGQGDLPRGLVCTLGAQTVKATAVAALAKVTGDRAVAVTLLVKRMAESEAAQVEWADVLAAERALVRERFGGSRAAYLAEIARAHANLTIARGAIADQLRRDAISRRLHVRSPSPREIARYADAAPALELPVVRATLVQHAREQAFTGWSLARQRSALARIACAHDELPQVDAVDLTDYLPFLALPLA